MFTLAPPSFSNQNGTNLTPDLFIPIQAIKIVKRTKITFSGSDPIHAVRLILTRVNDLLLLF